MKRLMFISILLSLVLSSCERINDDRIPPLAVNIEFSNVGMWNTYGVAATPDYRFFI